jgi:hypothetical protein
MIGYLFASATAFAMMTSGVLAQSAAFDTTNSIQPIMSTTGPAGTYDMTKTRRTIDSRGTETDTTETFSKSQTYTGGDGELSARTSIRTAGSTTTTEPSHNLLKESTK